MIDGKPYHYELDWRGMPIRLWSGEGELVWQANADAWGNCDPSTPSGPIHQPIRLPGQFEDELTGLYHNRFRDYDPETGRYLTPDPIGIKGGLNSYRYTPNPLDYIDPLGLDYESIIGAGNADKTELAALSNMKPDIPSMVETNGADVGSIRAMEPNWFRDTITGGVVNAMIGGPATDIADAWRNTFGNEKYTGINPLTNQNEGLRTGPERFMDWAPIPAAKTSAAAKSVDNLADAARTATRAEVPDPPSPTAQEIFDNLPERLKSKTVSTDTDIQTLSGYSANKPEQFTHVDSDKVIARSEEIGHKLRPAGAMDQGVPGRFNASHAEKQVIVQNPDAGKIDVSRPQCSDCQKFFTKEAQHQNRAITVSDPEVERTFMPDGTVNSTPRGSQE